MKFSNLIGHESIRGKLCSLIGVPGAYIFYGPPSTGKRTVAMTLARYFLCREKIEDECTCGSCLSFTGGHPDLLSVGQNGKILVEDIDEIISFVSRAPLVSNTKIVIINNADIISYEASNRLLKTLEESPFTFFLVTSELSSIIPTIKSRCIKISFEALNQDEMVNVLWKRMGFDLSQARIIGWIGAGSSADIFSNAGTYLKYRDLSFDFINVLNASDFINVWDFIDKIPKNELTVFNTMLMLVLTDILLLSYCIESVVNADRRQDLQKLSKNVNSKSLILVLNILSQMKKNSHLNINMNIALKSAMIKIWAIIKA